MGADVNCIWVLELERNMRISLNLKFNIEFTPACEHDFLKVVLKFLSEYLLDSIYISKAKADMSKSAQQT